MSLELVGLSIIGIIGIAIIALVWNAFWLWWQSVLSNAPVGLLQIIFMRFRKVRPALIVRVRVTAKKAGIDIAADELEAHYLAGGDVRTGDPGAGLRQKGKYRAFLRPRLCHRSRRSGRQGGGRYLSEPESDRCAVE